ncbi:MAG: SDR family NAD(P)-dependent oxidoreductase [Rhodospirillaceae bacterium]|nr:SDR family NAD(P)-dependent oxidoreductase [Rhodospirillaceae bacterium]
MGDLKNVALVVGAGPQLGAAVARRFGEAGLTPVLSARNAERLAALARAIPGAVAYPCDATDEGAVARMLADIETVHGPIDACIYNPGGGFGRTPVTELTAARFEEVWRFTAFGGFLVGREVARRMAARRRGTIIYTGATASMRGGPGFSAFASGKFALRALAQSMARELQPQGIHVVHVVIDGMIGHPGSGAGDGTRLDPDHIASTYAGLYVQGQSNWTHELDVRPWNEKW